MNPELGVIVAELRQVPEFDLAVEESK